LQVRPGNENVGYGQLFITDERKFFLKGKIDKQSKRHIVIAKGSAFDFF